MQLRDAGPGIFNPFVEARANGAAGGSQAQPAAGGGDGHLVAAGTHRKGEGEAPASMSLGRAFAWLRARKDSQPQRNVPQRDIAPLMRKRVGAYSGFGNGSAEAALLPALTLTAEVMRPMLAQLPIHGSSTQVELLAEQQRLLQGALVGKEQERPWFSLQVLHQRSKFSGTQQTQAAAAPPLKSIANALERLAILNAKWGKSPLFTDDELGQSLNTFRVTLATAALPAQLPTRLVMTCQHLAKQADKEARHGGNAQRFAKELGAQLPSLGFAENRVNEIDRALEELRKQRSGPLRAIADDYIACLKELRQALLDPHGLPCQLARFAKTAKEHPEEAARLILQPFAERVEQEDRPQPDPVAPQPPPPVKTPAGMRYDYERVGSKLTGRTAVAFTDAAVEEGSLRAVHSVEHRRFYKLQVRRSNGKVQDAAFIPLHSMPTEAARHSGVSADDHRQANRAIAVQAYAKALHFPVVSHAQVAWLTLPDGKGQPELGLISAQPKGVRAGDLPLDKLKLVAMKKEMTRLQLLDHLTGHVNRHSDSYHVDVDAQGRVRISAGGNDASFGSGITHPAGIRHEKNHAKHFMYYGTGLPPVMDREMVNAINALSAENLEEMLGDQLSERELSAALMRLDAMKAYIAGTAEGPAPLIIGPNEWHRKDVQELLKPDNSYWAREVADAQRAQARAARAAAAGAAAAG